MSKRYSVHLADLVGDIEGHFYFMQTLGKIENASYIDTCERKILVKRHPISGFKERFRIFRKVLSEAKDYSGNKIVHFQTGDKFYFLPILLSPETKNCKVVITLHRCPTHPVMITLLKNFSRKISTVVALSEMLAKQLTAIGVKNVIAIEHPSFYDYSNIKTKEELKEQYKISEDKIVISALGGTRFDKGLDLLLDSFSYLTEEEKDQILLNIAGRPQHFDAQYINNKIQKYGIRAHLNLRNLSNSEFCENIRLSDWIAIPYRKTFTGVSGPMVEAISQGVPCLVPENSSLHVFCKKFEAAKTFLPENAASLAKAIQDILPPKDRIHIVGSDRLSSEYFIKKHIELYNTLFQECSKNNRI